MKIIGESDNTYIVEITKDELAYLQNLYSRFNYNNGDIKMPHPGDEIDIKGYEMKIRDIKSSLSAANRFSESVELFKKVIQYAEYIVNNDKERDSKNTEE